jgi:hypothetical protein
MKILKESMDVIVRMLLMQSLERDRVNMSMFKKLITIVKDMENKAKMGKPYAEKFTKISEISRVKGFTRQGDGKGEDSHEK